MTCEETLVVLPRSTVKHRRPNQADRKSLWHWYPDMTLATEPNTETDQGDIHVLAIFSVKWIWYASTALWMAAGYVAERRYQCRLYAEETAILWKL